MVSLMQSDIFLFCCHCYLKQENKLQFWPRVSYPFNACFYLVHYTESAEFKKPQRPARKVSLRCNFSLVGSSDKTINILCFGLT